MKNTINRHNSIDGHVHTKLCHHARGEMEEYVLAAIDQWFAQAHLS